MAIEDETIVINVLHIRKAGHRSTVIRATDLFETFPASRYSLTIRPEWNNISGFRQFQIRSGATIFEGRTTSQGAYLPGGQIQKFVPNWREDLFLP